MLKKLFLGFIAISLVLFGGLVLLMGYVFNNPDKVFNAITSVTEKFLDSQPYREEAEFFMEGMGLVQLNSRRADLYIKTYDGNSLKILITGKVPSYEQGPFVFQTTSRDDLKVEIQEPRASSWVQFNINGEETTQESNSQLSAEIFLPLSYKGKLEIKTRQGNVNFNLPEDALYEIDLKSNTGKIENKAAPMKSTDFTPDQVGRISIQTQNGNITVQSSPAL